jgi:GMP synthase (glutamine-hydrolysing)
LKIVVVNNYKEDVKAQEAVHNLARCTGHQPEMLDYKTRDLVEVVRDKSPDLVVMTGSNYMLSKLDTKTVFQEEMDMVKKLDLPYLGICFGHQLIGAAYGAGVADIGQTVRAFKEVRLIDKDPVFDGLPGTIRVSESHRQALTELPREFRLLAESSTSNIEAIAHKTRLIYGVQFHPERSDDKNPHGRTIIQNFVKLVAKS